MPIVPSGFVNQAQLINEVDRAILKLGKKAIRVRHSIGTDWNGDPAIYFRIILPDAASKEEALIATTGDIMTTLSDEIRPYEDWGLIPYFSFRSKSEQAKLNEPEWS